VEKFTSSGAYLAQWGSLGSGPGQFQHPLGVAVDAGGNVYVADAGLDRIQVFGVPPTPTKSTSWGRIKALYR
jgi:tripartite motif-containing protein 71